MAVSVTALRRVGVYDFHSATPTGENIEMPEVFGAPIRPQHVRFMFQSIAKNSRQAYAVKEGAGYETSAESWGTGRAVARIPRVPGGGTHRAGQAAFGNMCRGGGLFSPTKTYRRWHRKTNKTERRHAIAGAIAASALSALVEAHGHRIGNVPELPLVVSDAVESVDKTRQAAAALHKLGLKEELERCIENRKIRNSKAVYRRGVKYHVPTGPLVVHRCSNDHMKAFHNLPGVEVARVFDLNLLQLAPGGQVGRLLVFSESAFRELSKIYERKFKYTFARPLIANEDINKIINSPEIQAVLRPKRTSHFRPKSERRNLLKNGKYQELNPANTRRPMKAMLRQVRLSKKPAAERAQY